MRRVIITLGTTAAGLAALLSFKVHSSADAAAAMPASSPTTSPTMTSGTSGMSGGSSGMASPSASSSGSMGSGMGSGSGSGMGSTTTLTGTVANTQYGPMQVQLVLTGKKITQVNILQRTDDGQTSNQIDSTAIPKLTAETLTAQSARIDAVSGATYTSMGYTKSLQSALDKAGM
jgi:hypothetical protein